jgi:methyl coenzyme M reductase gamma subunit
MNDAAPLTERERERASLFEEAASIVRAASARGRELTTDEDSHVLALMNRVRILEEEIGHLKRHPGGATKP